MAREAAASDASSGTACSSGAASKPASRLCGRPLVRRLWLFLVAMGAATVEVLQHLRCGMSPEADVGDAAGPGQCATVMYVHDYTELLCKAGLMVCLAKAFLRMCSAARAERTGSGCDGPAPAAGASVLRRNAPVLAYILWPGAIWVAFGEGGFCGPACVYAEACMEHACCLAILVGVAAALHDIAVACALGGRPAVLRYCLSSLYLEHDLDDLVLTPAHVMEDICSESAVAAPSPSTWKQAVRLLGLWSVYLGTAALYVAITWGGWAGNQGQAVLFRFLDTVCHAGLCLLACRLVAHGLRPCLRKRDAGPVCDLRESALLEGPAAQDLEAPPAESSMGGADVANSSVDGAASASAESQGQVSSSSGDQKQALSQI